MKFYNKNGKVIEAVNTEELIAKANINDADYESVCILSSDFQIKITLYYMYDEKKEPVYIANEFRVLNPLAKSITDEYNKNGYTGDTVAFKSEDISEIVKQILEKAGRDKKSSIYCSANFYTEQINRLKKRLRNKLNKEKFLIHVKNFKNELNTLLDKYGFCFDGNVDSSINDDSDITAHLYIKETKFTDSKRHKIEIMKIEDGIAYPEFSVDSVVQESY